MKNLIRKILDMFSKNEPFECYEIHVVQSRMFGCSTQCKECVAEQALDGNKKAIYEGKDKNRG